MVVDQTGSHQLMEKRPEDEAKGDGKRARKYTEKGLQYQRSVLMERRSQLHERLMRKSSIIDDLLYSKQNLTVVKENLGQVDDVFTFFLILKVLFCFKNLQIKRKANLHITIVYIKNRK